MSHIPFNKPYMTGFETKYIEDAVNSGKISGNGKYTQLCQEFFQEKYNFKKCLLTSSCTDALEMAAILIDIQPGDEVIMPAYTFVSTANAFVLRGAIVKFVDSRSDHPGMEESKIEALITQKTKAIVVVHYAGVACDMDVIMEVADKHKLFVVEDAAQAIDNYYCGKNGKKPLGGIGHLAAFSFHETKNIISGEGGMLVINDERFCGRSEIIWEKGTNRAAFFRGEIDKYGWVDIGSSFLPSDIVAAFLWAQIENLDKIQQERIHTWNSYYEKLNDWSLKNNVRMPFVPLFSENNGHIFYLVCESLEKRNKLISCLKEKGVNAVFHYQSLDKSNFYRNNGIDFDAKTMQSDMYSDCLVRLPLYVGVDYEFVIEQIRTIDL